jgi:hypothetical protein
MSCTHRKAFNFFCGVISYYDILSCATTGVKPWIPINCLRSGFDCVHLDKIMGCENWAMCLIMDIAILNEWRATSERRGILSMRDLVRRAEALEQRLADGLARITQSRTDHVDPDAISPDGPATIPVSPIITRIFASAALVYLHVVVSGPHPELPEIQKSVSDTVAAFKGLPDPRLMRGLTWPFTIAGCMAMGTQQHYFRTSLSAQCRNDPACGNLKRRSAVIEECWRMRQDMSTSTSCWMTSMRSLDEQVLLV